MAEDLLALDLTANDAERRLLEARVGVAAVQLELSWEHFPGS